MPESLIDLDMSLTVRMKRLHSFDGQGDWYTKGERT